MDAVGAVGGARRHLVQEHHVALPFLDAHGGVEQPRQLGRQRGELVVMRGKQRAAAVLLVQMLDRRPGDRQAVEGRGAAPDLVEDDERALARLVEDRRGLDHLDHEGRAAAREIVGRADAAEQPVDHADPRALGRHEAAHLRQHGDQRVLAQKVDLPAMLGPVMSQSARRLPAAAAQIAIIGDERAAVARQRRSTTGWRPPAIDESRGCRRPPGRT